MKNACTTDSHAHKYSSASKPEKASEGMLVISLTLRYLNNNDGKSERWGKTCRMQESIELLQLVGVRGSRSVQRGSCTLKHVVMF